MDSLATLELPAVGYGIRYEYGIFEQRIEAGEQVEHADKWLEYGNPWELPRHDRVQTVRLYGRTRRAQGRRRRLVVDWVDARAVIGLPYDSFIVGHETDTVNTLRLWSARASQDFDLRLFNEGDYRAPSRRRSTSRTSPRCSTPTTRPSRARSCASSSSTSSSPAPSPTSSPSTSAARRRSPLPGARRDPAQRHPPGDRRRRADARARRRGAPRLGHRLGHHAARRSLTPTTRCCPRRSRSGPWRCSGACCRGTCRSSTRSTTASCAR